MAAIITQSCSGGWIAQKHTSMTKPILRLLKLNKGIDLLRCFEDMSLRDASVVCKISFNSLSLIKDRLNYKKWRFHQLRTGRAGGPEKWDEIQAHRSKMIQVFSENESVIILGSILIRPEIFTGPVLCANQGHLGQSREKRRAYEEIIRKRPV